MSKKYIVIPAWLLIALATGLWAWRYFDRDNHPIPTRGGEAFNKAAPSTASYLQHDPEWANETIGGSRETLGQAGDAVCCIAMALDYHGIKLSPADLNNRLKGSHGYDRHGRVKWEALSGITDGLIIVDHPRNPSFENIDTALANSELVIARVLLPGPLNHWVLIVGKENTEYLVRDPLDDHRGLKKLS